jgi:hypothetical protein
MKANTFFLWEAIISTKARWGHVKKAEPGFRSHNISVGQIVRFYLIDFVHGRIKNITKYSIFVNIKKVKIKSKIKK